VPNLNKKVCYLENERKSMEKHYLYIIRVLLNHGCFELIDQNLKENTQKE